MSEKRAGNPKDVHLDESAWAEVVDAAAKAKAYEELAKANWRLVEIRADQGNTGSQRLLPVSAAQTEAAADIEKIVEIAGDENAAAVFRVINDQQLSAEQKLERIADIDKRFYGKDSEKLGILVSTSGANVRKMHWWTVTRRKYLDGD